MKFFADTAEVKDIRELYELGLLDGITTNPSLIAKSGRNIKDVIKEICSIVPGPVSAEVASTTYDQMMAEADVLSKIADNVVVKLPLTLDGLRGVKTLTGRGIKVNVTLCFSANQALLAAKAGATYISPFVGRLDDIDIDGMDLIRDIRQIYDNHVTQAALAGADVATIPPAIIKKLADHPLTKSGLEQFVKDWASTGQKIV
jgi:transaldolase